MNSDLLLMFWICVCVVVLKLLWFCVDGNIVLDMNVRYEFIWGIVVFWSVGVLLL